MVEEKDIILTNDRIMFVRPLYSVNLSSSSLSMLRSSWMNGKVVLGMTNIAWNEIFLSRAKTCGSITPFNLGES